MTRRIFRYEIPVDDKNHDVRLSDTANVLKVGARSVSAVEFWAEHNDARPEMVRTFRVFGTGQAVPDGYRHVGTPEPVYGGALVFHLYERMN